MRRSVPPNPQSGAAELRTNGDREGQAVTSAAVRTSRVLAEQAGRADLRDGAECTDIIADYTGASTQVLAEQVRGPLKRGSKERLTTASLLDNVLSRRAERGDENCSTRAVAKRCKTNPCVIHEYRHADKLAPWALAWVLPLEVVEEINDTIVDRSSSDPARPSAAQVALARCAFDLLVAEEDNHHPGAARHFWLPVDPTERVDCECKADEVQVTDADGYRWSNAVDRCRGCDLERSMRAVGVSRPCPIHATTTAPNAAGDST